MENFIDTVRYPLDERDGPEYADLVARCRADLDKTGMFNLEGFLKPEIAKATARRLEPVFETGGYCHARAHNIYFRKNLPDLPSDHPALTEFETSNHTLCADQLPAKPLLELYEWPAFARFLADCMGKKELYPMADPLARVNCMRYRDGQALNWHFDRSEFTTTLLLQAPAQGGEFEYRPGLRNDSDPNYDGVARMLLGQDDRVKLLTLLAGTLNVFRGKNTAHRVTPVKGSTARIIAVFSYFDRPGVEFSVEEQIGFYGRATG